MASVVKVNADIEKASDEIEEGVFDNFGNMFGDYLFANDSERKDGTKKGNR